MERYWKRITLFSFAFLALGVGLRWVRAIQSDQKPLPASLKTLDQYWAETGLGLESLSDLLENESCRGSQRSFLACTNALVSVATRLGYELTLEGQLRPRLMVSPSDETELALLGPWKEAFAKDPRRFDHFDFVSLWQDLMELPASSGKESALAGAGVNAFLSVFRDPHTYILPLDYYQNVISNPRASTSVLGIVLARSERGYFLQKVIEGSPAAQAGLRRGDWVIAIDGHRLKGLSSQALNEMLRSSTGIETKITVMRERKTIVAQVRRSLLKIPSVAWKELEAQPSVGVLTLHKFAKGSCADMRLALNEMKKKKLQGLLLDLRDNSGGQMDEAACMVSLFVGPEKVAFRIRFLDPSRDSEIHYGSEQKSWPHPMAILINSGTASAAEILAGSLRDHHRALLVGERTFGKGSFQEGELWNRNSKVAFFQTKGFYYLPSGFSPQMKGVAPDLAVDFRRSLALREIDQYIHPLSSPNQVAEPPLRPVDWTRCSVVAMEAGDPQLNQAQAALRCGAVAGGGSRATF